MNQISFKKFIVWVFVVAMTCCLGASVICLTSCDKIVFSATDIEKAATSTYFAQVNSLSKDFNFALSNFQTDVKEKNVSGMQDKLKDAQGIIDDFNKIDVPNNCEDVHKAYSDGYIQLQQALSDYIQIYSDFVSGEIENTVLQERIVNVQKSYNEGLDLLRQADKLASEK